MTHLVSECCPWRTVVAAGRNRKRRQSAKRSNCHCRGAFKTASGRKTQPRIAFRFPTPVFDSHVGRIGLLSPELSFKVSSVYGQFKGFNTQAQDQVPEMDPALAVRIMRSVHDTLWKLSADAESLASALTASATGAVPTQEDLMFVDRAVLREAAQLTL